MTNRIPVATVLVVLATIASLAASGRIGWTRAELEELRSMSLTELEPLRPDPTNRVADDSRAAEFGRQLFFEMRLSSTGRVACSTCHQPDRGFQDGIARATGVGTTARRTMPIAGTARSPFLFWDGRKDSLWAQALGPLESPVEHGGTRAQYAHVVADSYAREYEEIFGALPDLSRAKRDDVTRVFVNIGKAIAAYERRIEFAASRFDKYVTALTTLRSGQSILTDDEIAGLRLFVGKANCTQCHSGPLFTSNEFHNTGVPPRSEFAIDHGRLTGATAV